jgi:hypothetical protein
VIHRSYNVSIYCNVMSNNDIRERKIERFQTNLAIIGIPNYWLNFLQKKV